MKTYIKIILMLSLVINYSCQVDDFLDQEERGRQQLDDFFSSAENSTNFVNSVYQKVNGENWWETTMPRQINEMSTDDNWAGNTEQPRPDISGTAIYNINGISTRYFNFFWESHYIGITRANIALERIPDVDMDEELKTRLIAETRFLRAFFYFDLVRNFGGVPIVTTYNELLQPEITDKLRASVDEVYMVIEEDLIASIDGLPQKSQQSGDDLGRVTKGAAQSLLAKVYLTRENWVAAKDLATTVVNSGEYSLEPLFENIYQQNHFNGQESIFEINYFTDLNFREVGNSFPITTGSRADQGWNWGVPTSDLENAFLSEGDNIRLRSTIIKHGEPVYGDPATTSFDGAPDRNKSGRINRKFYIPVGERPTPYQRGTIALPYIHIRLADVILMHAEASFFAGDEAGALNSLKLIRDRVQLTTDMSLTGDVLRDAIWKERRLELALEHHRLFDLRRQKINGVPRIALVMGANGSFVNYNVNVSTDPFETTNLGEPQNAGASFDVNTHLVWPIPTEEIQLSNGNITQNPGY